MWKEREKKKKKMKTQQWEGAQYVPERKGLQAETKKGSDIRD